MNPSTKYRFDTKVIHSGINPDEWQGATLPPIFQTASHRIGTGRPKASIRLSRVRQMIISIFV